MAYARKLPDIDKARAQSIARIGLAFHIAKRREALGLTQEQLAHRIGLVRTSVVNIESGRQGIHADTLPMIAKALKWTLGQLVKGLE